MSPPAAALPAPASRCASLTLPLQRHKCFSSELRLNICGGSFRVAKVVALKCAMVRQSLSSPEALTNQVKRVALKPSIGMIPAALASPMRSTGPGDPAPMPRSRPASALASVSLSDSGSVSPQDFRSAAWTVLCTSMLTCSAAILLPWPACDAARIRESSRRTRATISYQRCGKPCALQTIQVAAASA